MPHIHELYDFTSSAFILHPTEPRILLLKHLKIGKWLQPLHHELVEETGLKPDDYEIIEPADHPRPTGGNNKVLPLPFYFNFHDFKGTVHQHIDITYLVRAKTDALTDHPDGAEAIGWFDLKQIKAFFKAGEIFTDTVQICEWVFKKYC